MNHLDLLVFLIPIGLMIGAICNARFYKSSTPPEGESQVSVVELADVYLRAS